MVIILSFFNLAFFFFFFFFVNLFFSGEVGLAKVSEKNSPKNWFFYSSKTKDAAFLVNCFKKFQRKRRNEFEGKRGEKKKRKKEKKKKEKKEKKEKKKQIFKTKKQACRLL